MGVAEWIGGIISSLGGPLADDFGKLIRCVNCLCPIVLFLPQIYIRKTANINVKILCTVNHILWTKNGKTRTANNQSVDELGSISFVSISKTIGPRRRLGGRSPPKYEVGDGDAYILPNIS